MEAALRLEIEELTKEYKLKAAIGDELREKMLEDPDNEDYFEDFKKIALQTSVITKSVLAKRGELARLLEKGKENQRLEQERIEREQAEIKKRKEKIEKEKQDIEKAVDKIFTLDRFAKEDALANYNTVSQPLTKAFRDELITAEKLRRKAKRNLDAILGKRGELEKLKAGEI